MNDAERLRRQVHAAVLAARVQELESIIARAAEAVGDADDPWRPLVVADILAEASSESEAEEQS